MKNTIFLWVTFILCCPSLSAQNELVESVKLATAAKIWGFLKYYHPKVASGKTDWDQELFELLPKVKTAKNKQELSKIYIELIDGLGEVKTCKRCDKFSDEKLFLKNFDLSWTQNENFFTNELANKLKFIENNRYQGKQYYVDSGPTGNVIIINESKHENRTFEEVDYRLLGLFRYWNIIEYFSPYKHLTDEKWNDVLAEMIPKFLNAINEHQYHSSIEGTYCKN